MLPIDDPLSVLPDEDSASFEGSRRFSIRNPDLGSIDPGERAVAGAMLAGSSLVGKLAPVAASLVLGGMSEAGSVSATPFSSIHDLNRISDLEGKHFQGKIRVGGLSITPSFDGMMNAGREADMQKHVAKLKEIQGTVDSFIDHHGLTAKGVRIDSPAGIFGTPHYDKATKRVSLPIVSKELALHELGHAADYSTRIGKVRVIAEPILRRAAMVAIPLALVAGDQIREAIPGSIDDKAIDYIQRNATALTAATIAATSLYPEAKANILAIRHIARTEGSAAARQAMTRLGPSFGTYLIGAIPALVGVSLAKRYMADARLDKNLAIDDVKSKLDELERGLGGSEKVAGVFDALSDPKYYLGYLKHIGKELAGQSREVMTQPGRMKRLLGMAKEVGTSPEAALSAASTAVPATMAALFLYGTESGKLIRDRVDPDDHDILAGGLGSAAKPVSESWREQNPLKFSAMVGLGAGVSAGIISKLMGDIGRVV